MYRNFGFLLSGEKLFYIQVICRELHVMKKFRGSLATCCLCWKISYRVLAKDLGWWLFHRVELFWFRFIHKSFCARSLPHSSFGCMCVCVFFFLNYNSLSTCHFIPSTLVYDCLFAQGALHSSSDDM